jgi:hypothetical protein
MMYIHSHNVQNTGALSCRHPAEDRKPASGACHADGKPASGLRRTDGDLGVTISC